jgi:hypothetical protein
VDLDAADLSQVVIRLSMNLPHLESRSPAPNFAQDDFWIVIFVDSEQTGQGRIISGLPREIETGVVSTSPSMTNTKLRSKHSDLHFLNPKWPNMLPSSYQRKEVT